MRRETAAILIARGSDRRWGSIRLPNSFNHNGMEMRMDQEVLQEQLHGDFVVLRCLRPVTVEEADQIESDIEARLSAKLGRQVPVLLLASDFEVVNMPGRLAVIEAKLDAIVQALTEDDDEDQMPLTLDGEPAGAERDQSQSLG